MAELHKELFQFAGKSIIDHPFFRIEFDETTSVDQVNEIFEYRKRALEQARSAKQWRTWVLLHYGQHQQTAALELMGKIPADSFFEVIGAVWTEPSTIAISSTFLAAALVRSSDASHRHNMMTASEKRRLAELPERINVIRTHCGHNSAGLSWTLCRGVAMDISKAYRTTEVTEGTVDRSDVIAYFDRRFEDEIIVHPSNVKNATTTSVSKYCQLHEQDDD